MRAVNRHSASSKIGGVPKFITPIPKPKKRRGSADQQQIIFDEGKGLSTKEQQYDPTSIINELRQQVDQMAHLAELTFGRLRLRLLACLSIGGITTLAGIPSFLLPGRSGGNCDLVNGGRAACGQCWKAAA